MHTLPLCFYGECFSEHFVMVIPQWYMLVTQAVLHGILNCPYKYCFLTASVLLQMGIDCRLYSVLLYNNPSLWTLLHCMVLLLLPLALQPTVGFGLSNNILPFFLSATNSLHLLTPSTWRSLSTSSFHPFLGLPHLLVPSSSWVKIVLGILSSSILLRWPNQLILGFIKNQLLDYTDKFLWLLRSLEKKTSA